jgi:hypothetical protein
MSTLSIVFCFLIALFVAYEIVIGIINRRRASVVRRSFSIRATLDLDEWYRDGFSDTGLSQQEVLDVLDPIAKALGCRVVQLRPEDSFNGSMQYPIAGLVKWSDEDILSDFFEFDLPHLLKSEDRIRQVGKAIESDPTVHALLVAIARTKT